MSAVNGAVVDVRTLENSQYTNNTSNNKNNNVNSKKKKNSCNSSRSSNGNGIKLQSTNRKANMSVNNYNNNNYDNNSNKFTETCALPLPLPSPPPLQQQQSSQLEWYDSCYQDDFTNSSEDYLYSPIGTSVGQAPIKRKKTMLTRTLLPNFVSTHGRTVYGGNPIVQQTLPGYFAYPSPFILIPIVFIIMIPFIVVGTCLVVMSHRFYEINLEYSGINNYQYMPMAMSNSNQVLSFATHTMVEKNANGFTNFTSSDDGSVSPNYGIRHFYVDGIDYPQGTRT